MDREWTGSGPIRKGVGVGVREKKQNKALGITAPKSPKKNDNGTTAEPERRRRPADTRWRPDRRAVRRAAVRLRRAPAPPTGATLRVPESCSASAPGTKRFVGIEKKKHSQLATRRHQEAPLYVTITD